ncbi:MAG: heme NO-binding domain-containing protein [Thermoplasmata archaeon]
MVVDTVKVKGSAVKSIHEFILKEYSEEIWKKIIALLDKESEQMFKGSILATQWYPVSNYVKLLEIADRELSQGNGYFIEKSGRYSADYGMNTFYKVFFKVGSVFFILDRAASVWEKYYSHGRMLVVERTEKSALLELKEFPYESETFCKRITAYMGRLLELTGVKKPEFKHISCVNNNNPSCTWRATWE